MQIMLLGSSSSTLNANSNNKTQEINLLHWLTIFNKFCFVDESSIWNYAPKLPESLTFLFLNRLHKMETYELLHQVLLNIDYKTKKSNGSIIEFIIYFIGILFCNFLKKFTLELFFLILIKIKMCNLKKN